MLNIQIFGTSKCFDTKKAQRWFKERKIKFQFVDIAKYGMSAGELKSCINYIGLENIINTSAKNYPDIHYLAYDTDKFEKLLDDQSLLKTPIVRNGKNATCGYVPDVWSHWE